MDWVLVAAGSAVVGYGWGSYHFVKHTSLYPVKIAALTGAAICAFVVVKKLYQHFVERRRADFFWREVVYARLAELWFVGSLGFGIFLFRVEWGSLIFVALWSLVLFWVTRSIIRQHPVAQPWLTTHTQWFALAFCIGVIQMVWQFAAYHYYILDSNIKFFNIVLFRSVGMTFFWLGLLSFLWLASSRARAMLRPAGVSLWFVLFALYTVVWAVNIGVLYFSGLHLSPIAVQHSEGAAGVIWNVLSYLLVVQCVVVVSVIFLLLRRLVKNETATTTFFYRRYSAVVVMAALMLFVTLTSFRNTPEMVVMRAFYDFYFSKKIPVALDPIVQKKLEKFGLHYDTDAFFINQREQIFTPTTTRFLPAKFSENSPNIVIIFLESFSARLSGVYNPAMKNVTPKFDAFATDPDVTIFKKYYNASTPTITGTLAQLCSFLPPTGHNEIQNERKVQSHKLLCLPEVLKRYAGYKYAAYLTAVDKTYAHKDGIFGSMGVDDVLGTAELAKKISGEPLSWGYSDHQLFPAMMTMMRDLPQPFLMMLATVDTHPPYNLPKDAVNFGDGSQPVLNMFHTTDDAFGIFWDDFKKSSLAENTIVIAVADHAIFPAALTKDVFPDDAGKLTYYDENFLAVYIPDTVLPKTIDRYGSGIDFAPTVLQLLNVNVANSFEGYSLFGDRERYPNLLGMHELGLYTNQITQKGVRRTDYNVPSEIRCDSSYQASSTPDFTLCDYLHFYSWKRQMFEEGRFWKKIP